MILPSKHISNCESLLGLSSILMQFLNLPISIDDLWMKFENINNSEEFPTYHSFDNVVLAIDLLFLLGKVDIDNNLLIKK